MTLESIARYRKLDPAEVGRTAELLAARVQERFPDSGLAGVARELRVVCSEAEATAHWLDQTHFGTRLLTLLGLLLLLALPAYALYSLRMSIAIEDLGDLLGTLESAVNDLIFMSIAMYFLLRMEVLAKRDRALAALHVLRSMAHIIDMHQLTKDPERVLGLGPDTASSPKRRMSAFELTRYLDYCSEMLALLSKVAAIYVEDFKEPETLQAVQEIEDLTNGLSRKIWQKITILDRVLGPAVEPSNNHPSNPQTGAPG
jgi:hypothetical protein